MEESPVDEKPVDDGKLTDEIIKPSNSQDDLNDDNERKQTAMSVH